MFSENFREIEMPNLFIVTISRKFYNLVAKRQFYCKIFQFFNGNFLSMEIQNSNDHAHLNDRERTKKIGSKSVMK